MGDYRNNYTIAKGQLDAGTYRHGLNTAQSESNPRQSWIHELRLQHGIDIFVCARFRCTNQATVGAHLKISMSKELLAFFGRGGQAVVPMCKICHDGARGGSVRVNRTPCVWDRNSPYNL